MARSRKQIETLAIQRYYGIKLRLCAYAIMSSGRASNRLAWKARDILAGDRDTTFWGQGVPDVEQPTWKALKTCFAHWKVICRVRTDALEHAPAPDPTGEYVAPVVTIHQDLLLEYNKAIRQLVAAIRTFTGEDDALVRQLKRVGRLEAGKREI